jgi:ElaB/YqjD/DUF883 family membrane-anchored ribosome-binding protein
MADQLKSADISALEAEIKRLRSDVAKIAETMHEIAGNGIAGAQQQAEASTEKMWTEVKRQAENVGAEIENRPLAAALTAFGGGILLGLLLHGRRS